MSRLIKLPPEFDSFTPEQVNFYTEALHATSYAQVQDMIQRDTGVRISINKLWRYFQKVQVAEQLEIAEDTTVAVDQLLKFYNGQELDIDKAGIETIKRRALEVVISPNIRPSLLLQFMRIFNWKENKIQNDHRREIDLRKAAHRDRLAKVAERRAACEERRVRLLESKHQRKPRPSACASQSPRPLEGPGFVQANVFSEDQNTGGVGNALGQGERAPDATFPTTDNQPLTTDNSKSPHNSEANSNFLTSSIDAPPSNLDVENPTPSAPSASSAVNHSSPSHDDSQISSTEPTSSLRKSLK